VADCGAGDNVILAIAHPWASNRGMTTHNWAAVLVLNLHIGRHSMALRQYRAEDIRIRYGTPIGATA